jgi:hypothetical protein
MDGPFPGGPAGARIAVTGGGDVNGPAGRQAWLRPAGPLG